MMFKKVMGGLAIAGASLWCHASLAEDIDLFLGVKPEDTGLPTVLLVLDNAGNFNGNADEGCEINGVPSRLDGTVGGIEQCALYSVIESLPENTVKIGIMVYNSSSVRDYLGNECYNEGGTRIGGCLVFPIREMTTDNKRLLLEYIENWTTTSSDSAPFRRIDGSDKANGGVMQEAWAYLRGDRVGLSGAYYDPRQREVGTCGGSDYVVFVGNSYSRNGQPGEGSVGQVWGPKGALEGATGSGQNSGDFRMRASPAATLDQKRVMSPTIPTSCGTAQLQTNNHENNGYYQDEWARYMKESAFITTYTVGVLGDGCQASYAALLTNTAEAGGGVYFPTTDYEQLVIALGSVFSQVIARNSVFASVTLPISVNTEDTYLNQVYIGMFRPDDAALPRWTGNLKQYRLGFVNNALRLVDARGQAAITAANENGDLAACALSYWTPTAQDSYWNPGILNCTTSTAASNSPDGYVVDKGGQGYTLRGTDPDDRNMVTCAESSPGVVDCSDPVPEPFVATHGGISAASLGFPEAPESYREAVIEWARGANNCTGAEDPADPGSCAVESVAGGADGRVRPSSHGDVVHSRPRALNFAAPDAKPQVVVFYGANDGTLRAINGNRGTECDDVPDSETCSTDIAGVSAGGELWSFMPPEFYDQIHRLRQNTTLIRFFEFDTGAPKPYGFDGPVTSFVSVDESGTIDEALVYATLRRGGRMVYAFDVSSIATDRTSPTIAWRFGCEESGVCIPDEASGIGQTWSAPQILRWDDDPAATGSYTPLLIMGGGYDICEDEDPNACDDTATGRAIYILNARTGALLRTFTTERPVVGDIFVVPDSNGMAMYAYAADLGGNVYRISASDGAAPFRDTAPGTWQMTTIAKLGCDATATCEANRKFFFGPDVVRDGENYFLFLGSGDREKPLEGYTFAAGVDNYFFMLRDSPLDSAVLPAQETANGCFEGVMCFDSLVEIPVTGPASSEEMADPDKRGWRLVMRNNEQVVTSAITVFGTVTFSTHTPRTQVCAGDLGEARAYQVNYLTAAPSNGTQDRSVEVSGGGLPPSPVAGLVEIDGQVYPFLLGGSATSPLEASLPSSAAFPSQPKGRAYWYISNE